MRDLTAPTHTQRVSGLVDVLDRVLDKGLAVAGDIKISLADVELLTIRIRLIICSLDKAQAIGLDWWKYDRHLTSGADGNNRELRKQVKELERKVALLTASRALPATRVRRNSRSERPKDAGG